MIYLISISRRAAGEWPNRGLYLMYGKLAVDLVRLAVYLMYFLVRACGPWGVVRPSGVPA